jgi:predicted MFS family arabinose efflux permease
MHMSDEPLHAVASASWTSTVRPDLAGIVLARLAVNGGIRVVYPFLPVIAHGLGAPLQVVTMLVASRSLAGLVGPLVARLAPPHRQRTLMQLGLAIVFAGCMLIAWSAATPVGVRLAVAGAGFIATGLARPLFDLAAQTWVSAHVPAATRGRALGVIEMGWGLSLAATVPVAGLLIERMGWPGPFLLVAAMAAAGLIVIEVTVRPDDRHTSPRRVAARPTVTRSTTQLRRIPHVWMLCIGTGLAVAAGEAFLVVYGEWLSDIGLSVAQIGASTLFIVTAELLGEGLVVAVADRVGLRRMLSSALLTLAVTYAALGAINDVSVAIAAISLLFVAFEIAVVTAIAFASTLTPSRSERARLMGALLAAMACGNVVGAALGSMAFGPGGVTLVGRLSACAVVVAMPLLLVCGRRRRRS